MSASDLGGRPTTIIRIQSQASRLLPEFLGLFGRQKQCAAAPEATSRLAGFRCPHCNSKAHYVVSHGAWLLFRCQGCCHQTSLTAGSLIEHSKQPLVTWLLSSYLISPAETGLSALALKRQVGVSYLTAQLLHHKISRAVTVREDCHQFEGTVQLDDAYLGERAGAEPELGCRVARRKELAPLPQAERGQSRHVGSHRLVGQGQPGVWLRGRQRRLGVLGGLHRDRLHVPRDSEHAQSARLTSVAGKHRTWPHHDHAGQRLPLAPVPLARHPLPVQHPLSLGPTCRFARPAHPPDRRRRVLGAVHGTEHQTARRGSYYIVKKFSDMAVVGKN